MSAPQQAPPLTQPKDQEPPCGVQGRGTASSPYDQGNEPETTTKSASGTEPPNSKQGAGTADEAYDKGNQPGKFCFDFQLLGLWTRLDSS
jgi:hypothetical protein